VSSKGFISSSQPLRNGLALPDILLLRRPFTTNLQAGLALSQSFTLTRRLFDTTFPRPNTVVD
jgi:hypothetical protein